MNESVKWMDVKTWIKEMVLVINYAITYHGVTMLLCAVSVTFGGCLGFDFVLFMLYVDGSSTVK